MAAWTGAIGSLLVFLASASAGFSPNNPFTRPLPPDPSTILWRIRERACVECKELWPKYSNVCLKWGMNEYKSCAREFYWFYGRTVDDIPQTLECMTKMLALDDAWNKCFPNGFKFPPRRVILHTPYREFMADDTDEDEMPDDSSDAPIGWRTIQGEWFQKVRRRSSGYGDL
ncbi:uncharacterized protein LOC144123083 [Amblyomma americanum]